MRLGLVNGLQAFPLLDLVEEVVSSGTLALQFHHLRLGCFNISRYVLRQLGQRPERAAVVALARDGDPGLGAGVVQRHGLQAFHLTRLLRLAIVDSVEVVSGRVHGGRSLLKL